MKRTEDIWSDFSDALRGFVAKRAPDAVDDVMQDIFLKVHANVDTLDDEDRIAAWVFRIARNVVVDHHRARQRFVPLEDEPSFEIEDDPVQALSAWLSTQIDGLPEPYASTLRATELEGRSQREVATSLGLSYSGLKSRVQRGRGMLLDRLLRCCHVELDHRGQPIDYHGKTDCCSSC